MCVCVCVCARARYCIQYRINRDWPYHTDTCTCTYDQAIWLHWSGNVVAYTESLYMTVHVPVWNSKIYLYEHMSRFFMCQLSGYVGVFFRTCQGVSCYLRCTNLIIQYVKIRQNNMTGYVRCVRMSGYVRMCRRDVQDVSGCVMLIKIYYNNTVQNI